MERLGTFIEQHQLAVVDCHAHAYLGGNGRRGSALQVGLTQQSPQLFGGEGQRIVLVAGDEVGAALLQLAVGVILLAVQGDGQGLAAAQHLFDAVGGSVLGVIGELGCGELHRGDGGSRVGLGLGLTRGIHGGYGLQSIGGGSILGGLVPLIAGHSGDEQGQKQERGGEEADELISFHDSFSFLGRMGGH